MCGGWYNRNAISVSSPGRCSRASLTASRPVRLMLARPFRNQGLSDHHTIVAVRLDLAIKPVSHRPGFKADLQPVVPIRQSPDRAFDRQRTVFDVAKKSDFPPPAAFRDRDGVLLLGDIKSHKNFAMLPMVRPPYMRLGSGCPSNPHY
jgi:hypothetical protein